MKIPVILEISGFRKTTDSRNYNMHCTLVDKAIPHGGMNKQF